MQPETIPSVKEDLSVSYLREELRLNFSLSLSLESPLTTLSDLLIIAVDLKRELSSMTAGNAELRSAVSKLERGSAELAAKLARGVSEVEAVRRAAREAAEAARRDLAKARTEKEKLEAKLHEQAKNFESLRGILRRADLKTAFAIEAPNRSDSARAGTRAESSKPNPRAELPRPAGRDETAAMARLLGRVYSDLRGDFAARVAFLRAGGGFSGSRGGPMLQRLEELEAKPLAPVNPSDLSELSEDLAALARFSHAFERFLSPEFARFAGGQTSLAGSGVYAEIRRVPELRSLCEGLRSALEAQTEFLEIRKSLEVAKGEKSGLLEKIKEKIKDANSFLAEHREAVEALKVAGQRKRTKEEGNDC